MRSLRIVICGGDDVATDLLTELAAVELPLPVVTTRQPTTALDELEATVFTTGQTILRRLLQAAWEAIDTTVATAYRQPYPADALTADGHEPLTVVSRFGRLHLPRQVLTHRTTKTHVLPANAVLPAHEGVVITRGLQEWAACWRRTYPSPRSPACWAGRPRMLRCSRTRRCGRWYAAMGRSSARPNRPRRAPS